MGQPFRLVKAPFQGIQLQSLSFTVVGIPPFLASESLQLPLVAPLLPIHSFPCLNTPNYSMPLEYEMCFKKSCFFFFKLWDEIIWTLNLNINDNNRIIIKLNLQSHF